MDINTDLLLPFSLGGGAVRGRLVRLTASVDAILAGHDYPPPVAGLLAETLALAATLAGSLKYDGIFTLQAQGNGPVSLVVADMTSTGAMRGYARFDAVAVAALPAEPEHPVRSLLGEGYLAFTVDQGPDTERYQGIVALEGDNLAGCVLNYFRQSEQLATAVMSSAEPPAPVEKGGGHGWRAAALMVQRMPKDMPGAPILVGEDAEDFWRRAAILLASLTEAELHDPAIEPARLLWRLYHAEDLVTFEPQRLEACCRCSRDKVARAFATIPGEHLAELADESGRVVATCEFCRKDYVFQPEELSALLAP